MGRTKSRRRFVLFWGVVVYYGWNMLNGPGLHWVHAGPKGKLLRKDEVSWRNINGVLVRTRNTQTFVHFRRLPWYMVGR